MCFIMCYSRNQFVQEMLGRMQQYQNPINKKFTNIQMQWYKCL